MIKPARGLGRGLDVLLGKESAPRDALATLPVGRIRPGKYQPRTRMDQQALAELAASIKAQGLMQPLVVRPIGADAYELIAGERRWRAAQLAGLDVVPVVVREVPDEAALAMLGVSLVALAAQGAARLVVLEASPPESPQKRFFESATRAIPSGCTLAKAGDLEPLMAELDAELKRRLAEDHGAGAPPCFLFVHELQKFKKLRHEEDFSFSADDAKAPAPGAVFDRLIREGPGVGMHVIATCDSYNSLARALSRKAISEFELRVLFQMSANDSATLCDSPKASDLGLHRALLHNGQMGLLETFRPYATPEAAWLGEARRQLAADRPRSRRISRTRPSSWSASWRGGVCRRRCSCAGDALPARVSGRPACRADRSRSARRTVRPAPNPKCRAALP